MSEITIVVFLDEYSFITTSWETDVCKCTLLNSSVSSRSWQCYSSSFCFSAIISASRANNFLHSRPIPPVAENTSGVKLPCSTRRIRSLYNLFFSFSLYSYAFVNSIFAYLLALGLKPRTSKNSNWPASQNPRAAISNLTSSPIAVIFISNVSPDNFCKWGSTLTSFANFL